jgi:pimeloyl-ACP methyl ester carboxylesterase
MFIDVDGIKIRIHESEKKLPLLYVHGSGGTGNVWQHQLATVGGYAIDLPGHGESEDDETIEFVEDYARYVVKVAESIGEVFIAGHSLGGAIAQMAYLIKPEIVKGLILVSTGARLRVLNEILDGLIDNFEETAKMIVDNLFSHSFKDEEVKKMVFKEITGCGSRITHRDFKACDRFDLLEDYRSAKIKIEVPVMCIVGSDDIMTPPKYSEFFQKMVNAEIKVMEKAGHMVMLERPDEVSRTILEFVEKSGE